MSQNEDDKSAYIVRCGIKDVTASEYQACVSCKRKVACAIDEAVRVTCGSCGHQASPKKTCWVIFVLHDPSSQPSYTMRGRAFCQVHEAILASTQGFQFSEGTQFLCRIIVHADQNGEEE